MRRVSRKPSFAVPICAVCAMLFNGPARGQESQDEWYSPKLEIYYRLVPYGNSYGALLTRQPHQGSPMAQDQIALEQGDMITHLDDISITSSGELENHHSRTSVAFINVRTGQPQANWAYLPTPGVAPAQAVEEPNRATGDAPAMTQWDEQDRQDELRRQIAAQQQQLAYQQQLVEQQRQAELDRQRQQAEARRQEMIQQRNVQLQWQAEQQRRAIQAQQEQMRFQLQQQQMAYQNQQQQMAHQKWQAEQQQRAQRQQQEAMLGGMAGAAVAGAYGGAAAAPMGYQAGAAATPTVAREAVNARKSAGQAAVDARRGVGRAAVDARKSIFGR